MRLFLTFFYGFFTMGAFSQVPDFSHIKKLEVDINRSNVVMYVYDVRQGETLYSIARFFKLPFQELMQINNIDARHTMAIGTQLKIPIQKKYILNEDHHDTGYIPILYKVKSKETLFKISHEYFPQPIENLIARNNLSTFSLDLHQTLIVGWWTPPGTKLPTPPQPKGSEPTVDDSTHIIIHIDLGDKEHTVYTTNSDPITVKKEDPDTLLTEVPPIPIITRKGTAIWDKKGSDKVNLFVLHNSAMINSHIKLRNPVVGLEALALVVGKIPSGAYPSDVEIIITPAVAKKLGALDSRFLVEMDYYE